MSDIQALEAEIHRLMDEVGVLRADLFAKRWENAKFRAVLERIRDEVWHDDLEDAVERVLNKGEPCSECDGQGTRETWDPTVDGNVVYPVCVGCKGSGRAE